MAAWLGLAGWASDLAGWASGLDGPEGGRTNGKTDQWTNERMENLPILQAQKECLSIFVSMYLP